MENMDTALNNQPCGGIPHAPGLQRTRAVRSLAVRSRAYAKGVQAEERASAFLRARGYRIVARGYRIVAQRYRTTAGEIDLVAEKGSSLVFAEVKARSSLASAAQAISPRQLQRIMDAGQLFLAQHDEHSGKDVQVDAFFVLGDGYVVRCQNVSL